MRSHGSAPARQYRAQGGPHREVVSYRFSSSRISKPARKRGTRYAGACTCSPVLGLRARRARRFATRNEPKPLSSILSPRVSASIIELIVHGRLGARAAFRQFQQLVRLQEPAHLRRQDLGQLPIDSEEPDIRKHLS